MENKQRIYLDKVVEFLVRDTKIDHDEGKIYFPFLGPDFFFSPKLFLPHHPFFFFFSNYCKNVYGLTDQEIEYVWNQYRTIILDKVENGK